MFRLFSWLTALFMMFACLPSQAQELLPPALSTFKIEVPELPAATDQSRYYGDTSASPAWLIAQWDIPGRKLSSFASMADGSLISHADEADVQIKNGTLTIS